MSRDDRKYSRVYHDAVSDPRMETVWTNDAALALWTRLLVLADSTWPSPAPVPRSARPKALRVLIEAGIVETVPGDLFTFHGLDAERNRRSRQAAHAAGVRWHADRNADSNADSNAPSSADVMPRRAETSPSKDEYEIPPPPAERGRRKDGTNPRSEGTAPRQNGQAPRDLGESPRQRSQAIKRDPTPIHVILARANENRGSS